MNVLMADTLMDTRMPSPAGAEVAAVPATRVGELLVYPRPTVRHNSVPRDAGVTAGVDGDGIEPVELVLDLRRWLISLPGGLSVPVECASAQAALDAAATFRANAESGAIGSYSPGELAKWAAWWCEHRVDAVQLDLGGVR